MKTNRQTDKQKPITLTQEWGEESGKESVMKVHVPTFPFAFSETHQQIMKLRIVFIG